MLFFIGAMIAAPDAAPSRDLQKPQAEKKICRKVETTSSRMTKRVCRTETEWTVEDKSATAADLKRLGAR